MSMAGCGVAARNCSQATTMAASEVFMSLAPRPKSLPSRWLGTKGSLVQASSGPVGTTSVWPAQMRVGRRPVPQRAHRLATRKASGPLSMRWQSKSSGLSRAAMMSRHPASSGVTEGRAISSSARRSVAVIRI